MRIEHQEVLELLEQSPIFINMNDSDLNRLAGLFQTEAFTEGEHIFDCGEPSEMMYILCEGQVELEINQRKGSAVFACLKRGDFFGEEALLYDDPRYYRAVAKADTILLRLDVENYLYIDEDLSLIEEALDVLIRSRRLFIQASPSWLSEDEFVHVITRRHPAILFGKCLPPAALSVVISLAAVLLQWRWLPERSLGWVLLGVGLPIAALWLLWIYFNWRNDYFLMTNKRVVWIEKIALIYESRHEAPLRTVMSVGMRRSRLGSLLGYADVVVMTYVGTIRLHDLAHAETVSSLIESYWHRSEARNRREEAQMMARKLQEKLDFLDTSAGDTQTNPVQRAAQRQTEGTKEPGFFAWLFSDFIRLRYEADGAVTYRKHWFVLVKKVWAPGLLMALALAIAAMRMAGFLDFLPTTPTVVVSLLVMFISFIWIVYQYADWRNDIFKVTLDQIIDIDRKPLGKVRRRSAPLENVLSIEYERLGFWGFLFNFGTVYISVGNIKLTFDYVYNPSEVQQDIFYRMGERLDELHQFEVESERERVSEWIASYHQQAEELQRKQGNKHSPDENNLTRRGEP